MNPFSASPQLCRKSVIIALYWFNSSPYSKDWLVKFVKQLINIHFNSWEKLALTWRALLIV
jgi:hypothetical protein